MDIKLLRESIAKGASYLLSFQQEDGRFEGELSANTFPTCAYALVQLALGKNLDAALIRWFIANQNGDGYWGLDPSGRSNTDATSFAKLILKAAERGIDKGECIYSSDLIDQLKASLARCPDDPLTLWIVKIMYARLGYISWDAVMPPGYLNAGMKFMEWIKPIIPKAILSRLKPPNKFAPPVRLFYSKTFQELFIAEKHTLVPLFLIMEIHTKKRHEILRDLANWLMENRCSDGSWFRVGLITAISILALIDLKASGYEDKRLDSFISEGSKWLQNLRTHDGGCREAISLNVWDTALSVLSLDVVGSDDYKLHKENVAKWLIENQNEDGGWAFSGLPGGKLPSDADDTALATLALLKSGIDKDNISVKKGFKWLIVHQSTDGGWGTYRPGAGDVNCVSITSHVIEACLAIGEMDNEINKGIAWIKSSISNSGYWKDLWLARNTYGTALAIVALIKSGHADCNEVKLGVKWLEKAQNPDGGWGEDMDGNSISSTIEQTAWSTYALLMNDSDSPSAQRGVEYLIDHQNPDGSWPASCVGIYWEVIGGYIDPVYSSVFPLMALSLEFIRRFDIHEPRHLPSNHLSG